MKKKTGPMLVVLSSPSGGGKTVIAKMLLKKHPEFKRSISFTTREKRKGEKERVDYHFISREAFQRKIKEHAYAEWALVFGNYYGTPKKNIQKAEGKIKVILLVLDVQGGMVIKRKYPESVSIFILPPSLGELEKRLSGRGTDKPDVIRKRLKASLKEISFCRRYDYILVNRKLKDTVKLLEEIITAEKNRANRTELEICLGKKSN
ncbi:MAG TPA: guanylate kinase [Terriglobales bacterium]|nr:guanylate kinase [Terriglobales bacterium]